MAINTLEKQAFRVIPDRLPAFDGFPPRYRCLGEM
jgi:hypothetical protein